MSRDDAYLVDILESAKIAVDYVFDKHWEEFYSSMQVQDAVIRRMKLSVKPRGESHRKEEKNTRKFPGGN